MKVGWVWLAPLLLPMESEKDGARVGGKIGEWKESCSHMVYGRRDEAGGSRNESQEQTGWKMWLQPLSEE